MRRRKLTDWSPLDAGDLLQLSGSDLDPHGEKKQQHGWRKTNGEDRGVGFLFHLRRGGPRAAHLFSCLYKASPPAHPPPVGIDPFGSTPMYTGISPLSSAIP